MKFKIGDRVKIVNNYVQGWLPIGFVGKVRQLGDYVHEDWGAWVRIDNPKGTNDTYGIWISQLQKVGTTHLPDFL